MAAASYPAASSSSASFGEFGFQRVDFGVYVGEGPSTRTTSNKWFHFKYFLNLPILRYYPYLGLLIVRWDLLVVVHDSPFRRGDRPVAPTSSIGPCAYWPLIVHTVLLWIGGISRRSFIIHPFVGATGRSPLHRQSSHSYLGHLLPVWFYYILAEYADDRS